VALLSAGAGVLVGLHDGSSAALPVPSVSTLDPQFPPTSAVASASTTPPTPAPSSGSELSELQQLNVVQLSERARSAVNTAVNGAGGRQTRPADAIKMMNQAIDIRQTAVGQAEGATVRDIASDQEHTVPWSRSAPTVSPSTSFP
jgi:hypothetical protein